MSDDSRTKTPDAPAPTAGPAFIDARRRGFLQGAVIAGGAAASGSALAHHGADHALVPEVVEPVPSGYRETDHVREYYATTRS